jgi:hypothetical protein
MHPLGPIGVDDRGAAARIGGSRCGPAPHLSSTSSNVVFRNRAMPLVIDPNSGLADQQMFGFAPRVVAVDEEPEDDDDVEEDLETDDSEEDDEFDEEDFDDDFDDDFEEDVDDAEADDDDDAAADPADDDEEPDLDEDFDDSV